MVSQAINSFKRLVYKIILVLLHALFLVTLIPWWSMVHVLQDYWSRIQAQPNGMIFLAFIMAYPILGIGLDILAWVFFFKNHPIKALLLSCTALIPTTYVLVTTVFLH